MREIKFRLWNPESKQLTYFDADFLLRCCKYNKDYVLMQYIGLKDKNGKEIYEGDIIDHEHYSPRTVIYENNHARFGLQSSNKSFYKFDEFNKRKMLVIGNIYENPELLKEIT